MSRNYPTREYQKICYGNKDLNLSKLEINET